MMYFYSQSMLHFKKKEFDKALENISKVKFEVYSIKFDAWGITLKSEFELGDYERAAYSLDSYKHSLISDRASPKWIKIRFQNFMNYFVRILKKQEIEAGFTKPEIESMQKEISGISEIADKNWLLGKLSVMAV